MKFCFCIRRAARDDLRLALWCRVLDTHIKTASPDRIAKTPLFVAGQHNEWNGTGFNCSKLWYRELPGGEDFKQHSLKSVVYLVQLVDKKYTWPFAFESTHERTWAKKVAPL